MEEPLGHSFFPINDDVEFLSGLLILYVFSGLRDFSRELHVDHATVACVCRVGCWDVGYSAS